MHIDTTVEQILEEKERLEKNMPDMWQVIILTNDVFII